MGRRSSGTKPGQSRADRHEDGREPAVRPPCDEPHPVRRWRSRYRGTPIRGPGRRWGPTGSPAPPRPPRVKCRAPRAFRPGSRSRSQATAPTMSKASSRPNVIEDPRLSPCALRSMARDRDAGPRQEAHSAGQDAPIGPDAMDQKHRALTRHPGREPTREGLARAGDDRHGPPTDPCGRRPDRNAQRRPHAPHRDGAERQNRKHGSCKQGCGRDEEDHPQELADRLRTRRLFGCSDPRRCHSQPRIRRPYSNGNHSVRG